MKKIVSPAGLSVLFFCALAANVRAYSPVPVPDINYTELHRTAERCDVEGLRAALAALPEKDRLAEMNQVDREGYTPLGYAAERGCMEIVNILVEAGANINLPGRSGWTPLMAAVFRSDAELVQLLVRKGADVMAKDEKGKTARDYAIERNETAIEVILATSEPIPSPSDVPNKFKGVHS